MKKITDNLIEKETANLAKECGFDIPVLFYFDGSDMVATQSKNAFDLKNYNRSKGGAFRSAPTQSELYNWLQTKHQIYIEILTDCTCEPKFCYDIKKFVGNPKNLSEREWYWLPIMQDEWYLYRTSQEAFEEALITSLNYILLMKEIDSKPKIELVEHVVGTVDCIIEIFSKKWCNYYLNGETQWNYLNDETQWRKVPKDIFNNIKLELIDSDIKEDIGNVYLMGIDCFDILLYNEKQVFRKPFNKKNIYQVII